jgi:hypothetical protein
MSHFIYCCAEYRYAECQFAEFHNADCSGKTSKAAVAVACVFVNDNLPMSMQLKGREDTLTSQGKAQYGTLWGQNVRPGILASSICS